MLFSCGNLIALKPGNMLSNQETKEYKNIPYIVSKNRDSIAIAGSVNSPCSSLMRLRVELLVENFKDAPSDFLFHEISASYNGRPLKVYSFSELIQEIQIYRNNQGIILGGKRFGGDDGSGIHKMMYDDRNYPPGNLNSESGRYFEEPSSESKGTDEKTESGFKQSSMYSDDFDFSKIYRESLQNRILKKGQPYTGILVIEHPSIADNNSGPDEGLGKGSDTVSGTGSGSAAGDLILSVAVGREIHKFNFSISKLERK